MRYNPVTSLRVRSLAWGEFLDTYLSVYLQHSVRALFLNKHACADGKLVVAIIEVASSDHAADHLSLRKGAKKD